MPKDTELHKAAHKGDLSVVEDLVNENKEDINVQGAQNRTPLHRAVGKGHNNIVTLLIDKKADVNIVDGGGLTPLHWAALSGLTETGKILIQCGAPVNVQTNSGETALHLAAEKGHGSFVKLLLDNKADSKIRDKSSGSGKTPYDVAKTSKNKEVINLLKPPGGGCSIL